MEVNTLKKKRISKKNTKKKTGKKAIWISASLSLLLVAIILLQLSVGSNEVLELGLYDGFLSIPMESINEKVSFYSYELDGTYMEFFAVKDSHGHIVTGMNTCISCYDSGKGYFTQEGDDLICNNCGNHHAIDTSNHEQGLAECAPVPLIDDMFENTDTHLQIKAESLSLFVPIFEEWNK